MLSFPPAAASYERSTAVHSDPVQTHESVLLKIAGADEVLL
jgi:hypothetical protein